MSSLFFGQCYEWAQRSTEFVASLQPGKNAEESLLELEKYFEEHQPVSTYIFEMMLEHCGELKNVKLRECVLTAQQQCNQAIDLVNQRKVRSTTF